MESTSSTAIGSSMIESGRRASFARTCRVISAVSDTPVKTASTFLRDAGEEFTIAMYPSSAQQLFDRTQVPRGGRRLVPLLAHGLADRAVERARPGHLPVDDALAARDLLVVARPGGQSRELVEDVGIGDE